MQSVDESEKFQRIALTNDHRSRLGFLGVPGCGHHANRVRSRSLGKIDNGLGGER